MKENQNVVTVNFDIDIERDCELLKELIKKGVQINIGNVTNNSNIMIWSATMNKPKVLEQLIKIGVDVTVKDNEAIKNAAENGHTQIVRMLINAGADVTAGDNYAIKWAIDNGHIEVVKVIMKTEIFDEADLTVFLNCAAMKGYTEIVRLLISSGAKMTDSECFSYVARRGYTEIVRLLIQAGANVTANDNEAIKNAILEEHIETVKVLIETDLISEFLVYNYALMCSNPYSTRKTIMEDIRTVLKNHRKQKEQKN